MTAMPFRPDLMEARYCYHPSGYRFLSIPRVLKSHTLS